MRVFIWSLIQRYTLVDYLSDLLSIGVWPVCSISCRLQVFILTTINLNENTESTVLITGD